MFTLNTRAIQVLFIIIDIFYTLVLVLHLIHQARRKNLSRSAATKISYDDSEYNNESIPVRKLRRSSSRRESSGSSSSSADSESSSENLTRRRTARKVSKISESKLEDTSDEDDGSSADEESEVEIRRPTRNCKSKLKVSFVCTKLNDFVVAFYFHSSYTNEMISCLSMTVI